MSTTAIVFPGQGSQSVGMDQELYQQSAIFREVFEQAHQILGYDLWDIIANGPEERLQQTEITQPALLACSVGRYRAFQATIEKTWQPLYFAGHSLGEYSALVCAGVCSLEEGLALVATRGRLMQTAVPLGQGAMMAILGLSFEAVSKVCEEAAIIKGAVVAPANMNTPEQTVIAGVKEAVEEAGSLAKAMGAKRTVLLPMSVPSHCALLKEAAEQLKKALETVVFFPPRIPIVHNVHAQIEMDPQKIKQLLVEQLYAPVRWVDCVRFLSQQGVKHYYECGPGKVLSGLIKRIEGSLQDVCCDAICA